MSHLHEDVNLTFGNLKTIFRTLASRKNVIEVQEKVDGQNVFFTYNVEIGQVRFARNNSHLKTGGMDRKDIVSKWTELPKVQKAYLAAYDVLQSTLSKFSSQKLIPIFGENGTTWYSAEVLTEINPNVINYDGNHIVLHEVGIKVTESGEVIRKESPSEYSALVDLVKKTQEDLAKKNWQIHGAKITKLLGAEDNRQIARGFAALKTLMDKNGLNNNSTIKDFLVVRVREELPEIQSWPLEAIEVLVDYGLGINARKSEIQKLLTQIELPAYENKQLGAIISKSDQIVKSSLRYLEKILNILTSQVLVGIHSLLINDPAAEVQRLRTKVDDAIRTANTLDAPTHEKLKEYVNQLGGVDEIKNAVEGIVFRWQGKSYKLTYPFNLINQILGLFRY